MNAETRIVCSKCGRSEEYTRALADGWLYAQRVGAPEGYLVIRCPAHISGWARRQAGLPGEHRVKRIEANLGRGLWTYFGGGEYVASAWQDEWAGILGISYHKGEMPAHDERHFETIDALIAAMRAAEPDLRKWRLCEVE